MRRALIGYTGFVGGSLLRSASFTDLYRSTNIEEIRAQAFETLICSGAPAEKWKANLDPESDLNNIQRLIKSLEEVRADRVILISTVDVYGSPFGVDETASVDHEKSSAYGRHRYLLEQFCQSHFKRCLILRLPALFGSGLKKNAFYDFIHQRQLDKIDSRHSFQFYNLDWLWQDIELCQKNDLRLVNLSTEPLRVEEWVRFCFDSEFNQTLPSAPVSYDVKSAHAHLWGRNDGYCYGKQAVLAGMKEFALRSRNQLEKTP